MLYGEGLSNSLLRSLASSSTLSNPYRNRLSPNCSLATIRLSSMSGFSFSVIAFFRWLYVSVSPSLSDSNIAHARPLNNVGSQRSFLASFHSLAATHKSYRLNQDVASPSSRYSGRHNLSPVAIGFRHQCNKRQLVSRPSNKDSFKSRGTITRGGHLLKL